MRQVVCFVALFFLSPSAFSSQLDLSAFLQAYMQDNNAKKLAELELKKSELNLENQKAPYPGTLSLSSKVSQAEASNQKSTSAQILSGISKKYINGISLEATASQTQSQYEGRSDSLPSQALSLKVSQDLGANRFGRVDQSNIRRAQALASYRGSLLEEKTLDQCLQGTSLYLEAYYLQQVKSLYQENIKDAEELFRYFSDFYKKKHIKKVDYLRSELNFVTSKSSLDNYQNQFRQALIKLSSSIGKEIPPNLKIPKMEKYGPLLQNYKFNPEKGPKIKSLDSLLEAQTELVNNAKWMEDTQWEIYASGSQARQESPLADTVLEQNSSEYLLGLNLVLPVDSAQKRRRVMEAEIDRSISKVNLAEAKRSLKELWQSSLENESFFKDKKNLAAKKVNLAKAQVAESKKLTQALRMEVTDYIRDRQQLVQQQIDLVLSEKSYLDNLLQMMSTAYFVPDFCLSASRSQS